MWREGVSVWIGVVDLLGHDFDPDLVELGRLLLPPAHERGNAAKLAKRLLERSLHGGSRLVRRALLSAACLLAFHGSIRIYPTSFTSSRVGSS